MPHAFVRGRLTKTSTRSKDPKKMIDDHTHVRPDREIYSEFSSWSASVLAIFCYADKMHRKNPPSTQDTSLICVVDTEKISDSTYMVPDLLLIGLKEHGDREYLTLFPFETLARGIVEGPGLVVHEWSAMREAVLSIYPEILRTKTTFRFGRDVRELFSRPRIMPSSAQFQLFRAVAKRFGQS
jgi:hypothetical protein